MRKTYIILTLMTVFSVFVSADEGKILSTYGKVEAKIDKSRDWAPAADGMEVLEGGAVRTGADGRAVLLLPNKSKVWLKESSSIELEQRKTMASRIALLFGSLKARVPHLRRREQFEIKTQTAVCAVRGTEFTVETNPEGALKMEVLYGEVKLNYLIPPESGDSQVSIAQGHSLTVAEKGKAGQDSLLTREQEAKALENWDPGLSQDQRGEDLKQKELDRMEVRQFAGKAGETEQAMQNLVVQVRESDLEAGRTLRDIHGNLVRVDQRMMRPDSSSLQIINLVKRPDYNYAHSGQFQYNGGPVPNRLDSLQARMEFNANLPENLADWPGFFAGDNVKPKMASLVMANQTDKNDIFVVATLAKYDSVKDELVNDSKVLNNSGLPSFSDAVVYTGNLSNEVSAAMDKLNTLVSGKIVGQSGGTVKDNSGNLMYGLYWASNDPLRNYYDVSGDPKMYQYEADPFKIGQTGTSIWLARENYVIDNGGGIRSVKDFTSSSSDPFSILKNTAGETIWYVKSDINVAQNGFNRVSTADHFTGKNIDLVVLPDLGVAAVQRMLSAINEIQK